MKILFVGVLDVSWSTNVEMKEALISLGHEVDDFNYRSIANQNIPIWQKNSLFDLVLKITSFLRRVSFLPNFLRSLHYRIHGRGHMNQSLVETAAKKKYDLVLFLKTDTVDPLSISIINNYSKTWYFFMDPMSQIRRINGLEYFKRATFSSSTFSDIVEESRKKGLKVFWITQGFSEKVFFPLNTKKDIDVFFAGAKTHKRLSYVSYLRQNGLNVICYGDGWNNPSIYQEKLVEMYNRSKIVLNFCRKGDGFSVRVFQVLATKSLLVSDYCKDLEEFFEKGFHLDWAKNKNDLLEICKYYLAHPEESEHISKNALEISVRNHTWISVMQNILNIIKNG